MGFFSKVLIVMAAFKYENFKVEIRKEKKKKKKNCWFHLLDTKLTTQTDLNFRDYSLTITFVMLWI